MLLKRLRGPERKKNYKILDYLVLVTKMRHVKFSQNNCLLMARPTPL